MNDTAAYELWYDYIRYAYENEAHRNWTEEVRRDFSGVLTKSFNDWYGEVWFYLFFTMGPEGMSQPMEDFDVREFVGLEPEDYKRAVLGASYRAREVVYEEFPTHTVLVLNLSYPKATLLESVGRFIDDLTDNRKQGRPAERKSYAKYPFARRPDVSSLKIALAAWKLSKKHENDKEWPTWRIGQELSKTFDVMKNDRIKETEDGKYIDLDADAKKKELEKNARRYLQLADAVLDGVVKGIFPAKPAPR